MQKQLHSVGLYKWYFSKMLISRKEKWVLRENGEFSNTHTLARPENSLEH
jgi:hypothetical protein